MPFNQSERISLSKTIINIPNQIAEFDKTFAIIQKSQEDLLNKDNFIKNLAEKKTILIDMYQDELKYINGQNRIKVTEAEIQKSGKKEPPNIFFPTDTTKITPSLPAGVWKYFTPFMLGGGIGKNSIESYDYLSDYEKQDINDLITKINSFVTTYTLVGRTTGQGCVLAVPPALNDTISNDPNIAAAMNYIITKVGLLKTTLQSEKSAILANTDTDSSRINDKNLNSASIDIMIAAINTWQSYPTFNTAHGKTTCASFNSYNPSPLAPTKGYDTQIQALKTALQTRLIACTNRETQINTYLGSVIQDINTGSITSTSGFYGERAKILDLRLNLLGGSLSTYISSLKSTDAVSQQKSTTLNAQDVYSSVLKTTKLKAPSNGTSFIHVNDITGYSVGQTVFLVSDSQQEVELTIEQITGTMIKVNKNIPPTYRPSDNARFYVDLS